VKNQASEIVMVPIGEIKPWPRNPNRHSVDQIDRLVKIIQYQGFRSPLVISKQNGFLIVGHGRLEAARKLGFKELPCIHQDFLSEDQAYAHCVADNAIAEWAHLDLESIKTDSLDMGPDFDLDLLGLKEFNLLNSEMINDESNSDEKDKGFIIEIKFPNDIEMHDIKDEMISRGYIVKVL